MDRRSWLILAGVGLLVALVVIVAVVLVTNSNVEESAGHHHRLSAEERMKLRPAFCLEEPDQGLCRAYFEMYHYNQTSDACHMFVYGGCDGNANRFRTMSECERKCFAGNVSPSSGAEEDQEGGEVDENTVAKKNGGSNKGDDGRKTTKIDDEVVEAGVKVEEGAKKVRRSA